MPEFDQLALAAGLWKSVSSNAASALDGSGLSEDYSRLIEVDAGTQKLACLLWIPWPKQIPAPWRLERSSGKKNDSGEVAGDTPYHVTAEFRTLPERWRWEFLRRNQEVIGLLHLMNQLHELAFRLLHIVGIPYEPTDDPPPLSRNQLKPRSPEVFNLWKLIHLCGWRLALLLEHRFGICFSGPCLHGKWLGPPSTCYGLTRGTDFAEWSDLWMDTFFEHSETEETRAVLGAWEEFVHREFNGWEDDRLPECRAWSSLTIRKRRAFTGAMERLRRSFNYKCVRQLDDKYYTQCG